MKHLKLIVLGVVFIGCMPQEMTAEEELSRARAQKAKHPERWQTLKKITPAEATQQERKWIASETAHNEKMSSIESEYRCG